MPLAPGTPLGVYEIVSLLGAGGMGEVYRARDPRLGRDVAIKILPAVVASDPERLARFEQEARATAALSHPNILAVFDIGNADGVVYIVSELLEGETLRETLTHGAAATRQAVDYAVQIAHGLAAAHEKSIVHRDLKPENIFVTRDGRVKILDFGLAKLVETTPAFSGTMMRTTPVSVAGMIVGTVGYMAPEQVRGLPIDHRADVFAFGAILYELLTGERAFAGETPADTISAILKEEPPKLANPARLGNAALHRVVQRCLEKKPEQRFHSAHDLAYAIEASAQAESGMRASAAPVATGRRPFASPLWIAFASVALVALGSSYLALRHVAEPAPRPPVARLTLTLPSGTSMARAAAGGFLFSVAPDGGAVVAALRAADGGVRLWLRPIDAFEFRPLRGTDGVQWSPFWSPDGRFIAFQAGGVLKRVAVADGVVETVATLGGVATGSWSADGILLTSVFEAATGLVWIASASGPPVPLKPPVTQDVDSVQSADLLSGGRILYRMRELGGSTLAVGSIGSTTVRPIGRVAASPVTVADGFLVFQSNTSSLMAQRFDEASARLDGDPATIITDDVLFADSIARRGVFSTSRTNGTLAYAAGQTAHERLVWVDRDGHPGEAVGTPGAFTTLALSRDGRRVAYSRRDDTGLSGVWTTDLGRNVSSRFSSGSVSETDVAWSPDGETIAFKSVRGDGPSILRRPSAGGPESIVLRLDSVSAGLDDWSRDGRFLLYHVTGEERALPLVGDRTPITVVSGVTRPDEGAFSPDGRLVALNADEAGRAEVYLVPFPPHRRALAGLEWRWRPASLARRRPRAVLPRARRRHDGGDGRSRAEAAAVGAEEAVPDPALRQNEHRTVRRSRRWSAFSDDVAARGSGAGAVARRAELAVAAREAMSLRTQA